MHLPCLSKKKSPGFVSLFLYTNDINKLVYLPLAYTTQQRKQRPRRVSTHSQINEAYILLFPSLWEKWDGSLLLSLPTKTTKAPQIKSPPLLFWSVTTTINNHIKHFHSETDICFILWIQVSFCRHLLPFTVLEEGVVVY